MNGPLINEAAVTVPIQPIFTEHIASGLTGTFAFAFMCLEKDDLLVQLDGVDAEQDSYAANGLGDATGTVQFSEFPAAGTVVMIRLNVKPSRGNDYQRNGDLSARILNRDFDRLWLAIQQAFGRQPGALAAPFPETIGPLPPATVRALSALGFDAAGNPIAIPSDLPAVVGMLEEATEARDTSVASAVAAAQSEVGAAQSETGAAVSAALAEAAAATAIQSGTAIWRETLSALQAVTTSADQTPGVVWGDTVANNGYYVWIASTTEWARSTIQPVSSGLAAINLFDSAATVRGQVISTVGTLTANALFYTSGYVPCTAGQVYAWTHSAEYPNAVVFYDANYQWISGGTPTGVVTAPEGAAYFRISGRFTVREPELFMIVAGNTPPPIYVPYVQDGVGAKADMFDPFVSPQSLQSTLQYQPGIFDSLEFWGLDGGEEVYLRSLWNYFFVGVAPFENTASLGFISTTKGHITIGLSPQNNVALYAQFNVAERLAGYGNYLLYRNGDNATPPIGRVVINWDKVANQTNRRFIGTAGATVVDRAKTTTYIPSTGGGSASNYWAGKKVAGGIDSITRGFGPRNDPADPNYPNGGTQLDSWLVIMSRILGMTYVNYGIDGSTLGDNGTGARSPFAVRYDAMDDDADLVVIMPGTNDARFGVPLGVMADRTKFSFYGALHVTCLGLIDKYYIRQGLDVGQHKQIMFTTPIKNSNPITGELNTAMEPYCAAIKEVCAYYSIPVLDMYNESGATPHILQTVQGIAPGYTGMFNPLITDGTHPVQELQERMGGRVAAEVTAIAMWKEAA